MANQLDVAICGGGLAGLTLALELKKEDPDLTMIVLEKEAGPLSHASHKVGESSVEGSTYWLMHRLGMEKYIRKTHVQKLGLRFFGGDPQGPFQDRYEIGDVLFTRSPAYQYDRGALENYLRDMCREQGINLVEDVLVDEIDLGDPHTVRYRQGGEEKTVQARWAIDAMGRRRYLQSRLKLKETTGHEASASWWRLGEEIDISSLVPESEEKWHKRAPVPRWFSTNHLIGHGYFVWIIPLCSNSTSIGIVADESIHPIKERNTSEKAMAWMEKYEPAFAARIKEVEKLDFRALKNFSFTISKPFSTDRWACIGDSAAFADPLYSLGLDLIALSNRMTSRMIAQDKKGELKDKTVDLYGKIYTETVETLLGFYRNMYPVLDHDYIMLQKLAWDIACYWAVLSQLVVQDYVDDIDKLEELYKQVARMSHINNQMQLVFRQWAESGSRERILPPGFYQFGSIDNITEIRLGILTRKPELSALVRNVDLMEELAQAFFLCALRDMAPQKADPAWKAVAMNLRDVDPDPSKWAEQGVFKTTGENPAMVETMSEALLEYARPVVKAKL